MWSLIGVAVVVLGFAARINPLPVIVAAALATGVLGGMSPLAVMAALGKAFNDSRYVSLVWLVLPVIGLLERSGLQVRARIVIAQFGALTTGRLLILYMALRQITAALGLTGLGGHPQMVRPLLAPMAEGTAEARLGPLAPEVGEMIRAQAAATDNVALVFGEDIFIALASILLIKGFLHQMGVEVAPLRLSLWAIPTAIAAFLIHGARLLRLDRRLFGRTGDGR